MPFNPTLAAKLHLMEGIDFHDMDAEAMSRMDEFYRDPEPWSLPVGLTITDEQLDGPHGSVPVRIYRPAVTTSATVLVWAHGGGFASGDLDMGEAHVVSAEIASRAGATVVSVGYRLATHGVRYPVPVDDVHAAWLWCADGGAGVSEPKTFLGGASAGAALALSAGLRVRDAGDGRCGGLLLAYPFAHFPNPALDADAAAELAVLPASMRFGASNVEWMVRNYVGRMSDLPPAAMPGAAALDGLPMTRIVISEYDDLRSSAELLERQLGDAHVPVESFLARGMPHGHLNRSPQFAEVARSLDFLADALR